MLHARGALYARALNALYARKMHVSARNAVRACVSACRLLHVRGAQKAHARGAEVAEGAEGVDEEEEKEEKEEVAEGVEDDFLVFQM